MIVAQKLDSARKRLAVVTRERARVLDLVTHDPVHLPTKPQAEDSERSIGDGSADPLGGHTRK